MIFKIMEEEGSNMILYVDLGILILKKILLMYVLNGV